MNYWSEDYKNRGIDSDLDNCLVFNPQSFTADDIERVLAVHVGENDGDDWRWVMKLKDGRFAFVQGGCDYTGWDCQSWAASAFADTPEEAAEYALGNFTVGDKGPQSAGLGHMINLLFGSYAGNFEEVKNELLQQIATTKNKTWHEIMDDQMPDLPKIE